MRSLILALALAMGAAFPTADAATLRALTTVEDGLVRLGDLFDDLGTGADIAVAHAPAPGRRLTFDAAALMQIAQTYRISWRPQSRFDRVIVERAGRLIQKTEISARLAEALQAEGVRRDVEVELFGRNVELAVPNDASDAIDVRNLSFDRQTGRFSAIVSAGSETAAYRLAVSGRVHHTSPVPVLRRAMGPGDVIRKDDIEIILLREDRIGRDVVTDAGKLVGMTPRQRLRVGEPIRENDTRPPVLVARNSTVTIVLQTGHLTLTAQGRAIEDGAKGDTIRVTNLQSKKTIEAVVAGPDFVTVENGLHRAVN
ncbi:MAG TPA: flagellar basal body P-ring formation chaperone FlgA [Alphaproteobacteria bacterium]|nr:flagellar basal body P-ring formation chaperone FlgA [Alphaproteobacteria bacterium]